MTGKTGMLIRDGDGTQSATTAISSILPQQLHSSGYCMLCRSTDMEEYASGFDFEIWTCANEWFFRRCVHCGHVQLDPRPSSEALGLIYPSTYYAYDLKRSVGSIAYKAKSFLDALKFRQILSRTHGPVETYLDIGCGDGRFLDIARRAGKGARGLFGIELDLQAVASARQRGFEVFHSTVEDVRDLQERQVDLVTMFHVIEHVADPLACLGQIRKWMRPSGMLALETPNIDSLDARLFRDGYWGGYHIPRHWHLFSPDTIRQALARTGFTVEAIQYQTGHSFWMYSFHHLLRNNSIFRCDWLGKAFDPLRSLPLLAGFTLFDLIRAQIGCRTSSMLVMAKAV